MVEPVLLNFVIKFPLYGISFKVHIVDSISALYVGMVFTSLLNKALLCDVDRVLITLELK